MTFEEKIESLVECLDAMSLDDRVEALNKLRRRLHEVSPFKGEPVDCVQWVRGDSVRANLYNPNQVAPVELKLLEHSIRSDGYTQPIVGFVDADGIEVVDGFHRHRVGKEIDDVRERVHGYLPIVSINEDRTAQGDRMASTIRHNRARGKHQVASMSDIVVDLARRGWNDEKISRELGMDADEVLRLKQITGLAEVFLDREFSEAWEPVVDRSERAE